MMRTLRVTLTLGLLLTVAACASQGSAADGNPGAPTAGDTASHSDASAAVSSSILPKPTVGPPTQADQANHAVPDSRAVNLRPVKWTQAAAGEGRQLLIHYTAAGLPDCNLLGRVDVTETNAVVTVTVLLGQTPGADCSVQTMIAIPFVTTVTLREPVGTRTVRDGTS